MLRDPRKGIPAPNLVISLKSSRVCVVWPEFEKSFVIGCYHSDVITLVSCHSHFGSFHLISKIKIIEMTLLGMYKVLCSKKRRSLRQFYDNLQLSAFFSSFWGRTHERTVIKHTDMSSYLTYYFEGITLAVCHSLAF